MKASTVVICDVPIASDLQLELQPLLKLRHCEGRELPMPHFPIGTVIEGPLAVQLVVNGQADPFDEECREACKLSPARLATAQRTQLAASLGINGKRDMAMFMYGAIEGYAEGTTDAKPVYIHGPKWDEWQAADAERLKAEQKDALDDE